MSADQLFHQIKQHAAQQDIDQRYFVHGHIAQYDPATHRVKVVIPSWRDELNRPVITPWMALASGWVGNGFGLQVAPFGGATALNPTAGEQVLVQLLDRTRGIAASASMFYTVAQGAPSPQLSSALQPGEAVLRHSSGSVIRLHANGDIELTAANNVNVTSPGTISLSAPNVTISGNNLEIPNLPITTPPGPTQIWNNNQVVSTTQPG